MPTIHCHRCGGFIDNPDGTTYREPRVSKTPAVPHSALCACDHPLLYEAAPVTVAPEVQ
jgi:hypothetical protein